MGVLFLIFQGGMTTAEIEFLLSEFPQERWAKAFTGNDLVYVLQVPAEQIAKCQKKLRKQPEIIAAEIAGHIRLEKDHAA